MKKVHAYAHTHAQCAVSFKKNTKYDDGGSFENHYDGATAIL